MTKNHDTVMAVTDLTKVYRMGHNEVMALRGVSFEVERGEMIAIMGASGSGKSTLMNLLGCLDRPSAGSYELDGIPVAGLEEDRLAAIRNAKIGFVFQSFHLLARTSALENVELPLLYDRSGRRLATRRLAEESLRRVGLADRAHHEPTELSGGQQQRVAIARALVTRPALLLADEPTGNLDSTTSLEVMSLFQQLNDEGMTILLVTHEREIARCARRTIELRDGRVLRDETILQERVTAEDVEAGALSRAGGR